MEYEVSVDRQGRIVIPAPVRKLLGLSGGGRLLLVLRDGRIELIPIDRDLEKRVNRWMELVLAIKSKPFSEEGVDSEWKWMDEKYVKRKLGLC